MSIRRVLIKSTPYTRLPHGTAPFSSSAAKHPTILLAFLGQAFPPPASCELYKAANGEFTSLRAAKVVRTGGGMALGKVFGGEVGTLEEHSLGRHKCHCAPRGKDVLVLVADSGEVILLLWKQQDPFAAREYPPPFVQVFGDLQRQIRICSTNRVSVERGSGYVGRRPNEQAQTIICVEL